MYVYKIHKPEDSTIGKADGREIKLAQAPKAWIKSPNTRL